MSRSLIRNQEDIPLKRREDKSTDIVNVFFQKMRRYGRPKLDNAFSARGRFLKMGHPGAEVACFSEVTASAVARASKT